MSLSIVIPTWNQADLTCRCLASLAKHTRADFEIIWIDNGSSDEQYEQVMDAMKGFTFQHERHPKPLGFARATNCGLRRVRAPYCVMLNNDVTVTEGWDEDLQLAVDDAPGLAGPITVNSYGWQTTQLHPWLGLPHELADNDDASVTWLRQEWAGTVIDIPEKPTMANFRNMLAFFCVLMPRSVLDQIGLLDENFGWGYCEDDDFCFRARQAGFSLSLCPGSIVFHDVGKTLAQVEESSSQRLAVNQRYLEQKWSSPP